MDIVKDLLKIIVGIDGPLTSMLRKNQFIWTPKARETSIRLKVIITKPPFLTFTNFTLPFVIKCDVFEKAIKVVLM